MFAAEAPDLVAICTRGDSHAALTCLAAELGAELEPGTFGENLTIAGLESAAAWVGDRLRIGDVLLEVTAPRIPCHILARRMDDPQFVKRFRAAERPGR